MNNKGMTTLEAAILVPLSLTMIMALIWMGFLLYNRTVLTNAANIATMKAAFCGELENEKIMEIMGKTFEDLVRGNLVCVDNIHIEGNVEYSEVTLSITGEMAVPIKLASGGKDFWDLSVEKSVPRVRKSMVIRTIERVANFNKDH